MLTLDSGQVAFRKAQEKQIAHRHMIADQARGEARDAHWVSDKRKSVANLAHQMGRKMTATEFANKLRKLNPSIIMEPHPGVFAPKDSAYHRLNKDKAVLNLLLPDGKKLYLLVCEGDFMPEWTYFSTNKVRVPDHKPEGMWKPVEIPWHREKRGWREVLIMLLRQRVITLEPVEREFGAGNRPSWKILTGKGQGQNIF